jgi:hypothetical protein
VEGRKRGILDVQRGGTRDSVDEECRDALVRYSWEKGGSITWWHMHKLHTLKGHQVVYTWQLKTIW